MGTASPAVCSEAFFGPCQVPAELGVHHVTAVSLNLSWQYRAYCWTADLLHFCSAVAQADSTGSGAVSGPAVESLQQLSAFAAVC